jgi:hypothetical protein
MSKAVWGPATWYLIHCIAYKLREDSPVEVLDAAKDIILMIASNLPCPYCTQHATSYLTKYNIKHVPNVLSLRMYLYVFHNKVNERLKKPQMSLEEHNSLYSSLNLTMVIQNMLHVYQHMIQTGVTMMLYNFHRTSMINNVSKYFSQYQTYYNLY